MTSNEKENLQNEKEAKIECFGIGRDEETQLRKLSFASVRFSKLSLT